MVGGIGVMAIMTISVTERTREIGVRKALGARRREILVQFLIEAVFLTSLGGLLGIMLGAGIGYAASTSLPASRWRLPLWSFGVGVGFSATVGILFGMLPAVKASKLDPIEALGTNKAAFVIRPTAFAKVRRRSMFEGQGRSAKRCRRPDSGRPWCLSTRAALS